MMAGSAVVSVLAGRRSEGNGTSVFTSLGRESNAEEQGQGYAMTRSAKVNEMRIYHVVSGRLDSPVARFRNYHMFDMFNPISLWLTRCDACEVLAESA
jgi:hypothetical protein